MQTPSIGNYSPYTGERIPTETEHSILMPIKQSEKWSWRTQEGGQRNLTYYEEIAIITAIILNGLWSFVRMELYDTNGKV